MSDRRALEIITVAAAAASWGIVSGFALFAKLWLETRGQSPLTAVVAKLGTALVITVVVAAFLEWMQERLDGGTRRRAWSFGRVLTSVVTLAAFEMVAVAVDDVWESWWERRHEVAELTAVVTGAAEPWALFRPEELHDARAVRAALFAPEPPPAVRRIRDLMPGDVRAQLAEDHRRDLEIDERAAAWSAQRATMGSLADRLVRGDPLDSLPPLPPLRSPEEVTQARRVLTQALNAVLVRPDLFVGLGAPPGVGAMPELTRALLADAGARLPARTVVRLNRAGVERAMPRVIQPVTPAATLPGWLDLAGVIGLWVAAGAVLGGALALVVAFAGEGPRERALLGLLAGGLASAVAAPLLALVYVALVRIAGIGWLMWTAPEQARVLIASYHLDRLPGPLALLSAVVQGGRWGLVILAVALVGAIVLAAQRESWWPLVVVGGALAVLTVPPLLDRGVLSLARSMAVVWLLPGLTLGALTPLLHRGRAAPKAWGGISLAAAAVVAALTVLRLRGPGLDLLTLLGGGLALALGAATVLLGRSRLSSEAWPVVAVALGIIMAAETRAVQATFRDVLTEVTRLSAKVSPRTEVAQLSSVAPGEAEIRRRLTQGFLAPRLGSPFLSDPDPLPEREPLAAEPTFYLPAAQQRNLGGRISKEIARLADLARTLEVTLVGSLGFWAATGLLAGWTLRDPPERDGPIAPPAA